MPEITLRQVEVIRAVMMTGTISGAAEMLHVSAPGISRLVKHTEESLGIRLFERKAGLFVPSVEAARVFEQIREVYRGVENLQTAMDALQKGEEARPDGRRACLCVHARARVRGNGYERRAPAERRCQPPCGRPPARVSAWLG